MRMRFWPIALPLLAVSCAGEDSALDLVIVGDRIVASGEVDAAAVGAFAELLRAAPGVTTLELSYVAGSVDDDANLELGRIVRDAGLATLAPSDGLIASGATDLFLAGVQRILEEGACVGVHAWAAEEFTANDIPRSDPDHRPYLDYYDEIGVDRAFYWYTLEAAPAEGMHWMTAAEVKRWRIATITPERLSAAQTCDRR